MCGGQRGPGFFPPPPPPPPPPPAGPGEREAAGFFPPPRLLQIARVCFISASSQSFESLAQPILPGGIVYHVAISKS